jgi:hypothetical protein
MGNTAKFSVVGLIALLVACTQMTPVGVDNAGTVTGDDGSSVIFTNRSGSGTPGAKMSQVTNVNADQFDPTADASMVLCLDNRSSFYRDTAGTQACADGDSCAYWADRSGKGYHAKAVAGTSKPVFRTNATGGVRGLVYSGASQTLSLGVPSELASLQSANFTLVVAGTWHSGDGFMVSKNSGASDGIYNINVLNSTPGYYHSNKGTPVKPDEFVTFCVASDRSKTEVSGVKRFYQNGVPRVSSIGNVSVDNSNNIEIGSIAGARQYYSWNGKILAVMLFSRTLTAAEILQTDQYLRALYSQPWQGASSTMIVLWDGNSISANGEIALMVADSLGIPPEAMFNFAWGSKGTQHMNTYAASDVDAVFPFLPAGKTVVSVGWEMSNDFAYGASASDAYQHVRTYGLGRRAVGMKHVVGACLPRDGTEPRRASANDSVRTFFRTLADGLADVASDPNMGQTGQNANTTYYGDGLHPNALGERTVVPYFVNAIREAAAGSTGVVY